ncbi:MAG: hypothetical protein IPL67_19700 [Ignavibacteria bacterium]|nr:hypothetical protein [Ignavibacteria bacterium]
MNNGLTNTYVHSLAVSGTNLFAGTGGGVFLSTNNGTNWTAVNNGLTNTYVFSLAVSGTNLFAGTSSGGVFLSTNNGTSWTAVNNGLTYTQVSSFAVSGTNLFAGTQGGVFLYEVATLVNEKQSPGTYEVEFDASGFASGVYFYKLVVSPSNPLVTEGFTDVKRMMLVK